MARLSGNLSGRRWHDGGIAGGPLRQRRIARLTAGYFFFRLAM
jgi:hypothetical protein